MGSRAKTYRRNLEFLQPTHPSLVENLRNTGSTEDITLFKASHNFKPNYLTVFLGAQKLPRLAPSTQMVLIAESSSYFIKAMLEEVDIAKWLGRRELLILCTTNQEVIRSFFYAYLKHDFRLVRILDAEFVSRPNASELQQNFFDLVKEIWRQTIPTVMTTFKSKVDHGIQGMLNFDKNAVRYHIDFRKIKGALSGVPAVICSGGPSLDKDLAAIKEFPGAVISCDAPYSGLVREGVNVDYVVSMDRAPGVKLYYENVDKGKTILACSPDVHPTIVDKFSPDVVYLPNLRQVILKELDYDTHFEGGTCVAHLAFCFARWLGCTPIILCGQDFGTVDTLDIEAKSLGIGAIGMVPAAMGKLCSSVHVSKSHNTYNKLVPEKEADEHWGGAFKRGMFTARDKFNRPFTTLSAFVEMKTMFEDLIRHTPGDTINSSHGLHLLGTKNLELGQLTFDKKEYRKLTEPTLRLVSSWNTKKVVEELKMLALVAKELDKVEDLETLDVGFRGALQSIFYQDVCYVFLSFYLIRMYQKSLSAQLKGEADKEKIAEAKNFIAKSAKVLELLVEGLEGRPWKQAAIDMENLEEQTL